MKLKFLDQPIKPQNLEEKVIWYAITGIYVWYIIGAQHLCVPFLAWGLTAYLCLKRWQQTEDTPEEDKVKIPIGVWVWIFSMLVVAVSVIGAHVDFNYDVGRLIRSLINFFGRTWLLLALFPLIGCLNIRPKLLYRAASVLCLQSLLIMPILSIGNLIGLPASTIYISPLRSLGGVGDLYYKVGFYLFDQETGRLRLFLFTPWAPALGFVGCIYFFLTFQETDKKWRWIGMIGSVGMVWFSVSRLGLLCLPAVLIITWFLVNIVRPSFQIATGITGFFAGMFGFQILTFAKEFMDNLNSQRASSSKTRALLARMAAYQWWNDAPIWGHGFRKRGPKVAAYMPVGSHHTWFGALYTNGIVGFSALAFAMTWTFFELVIKAQTSKIAYQGLCIFFVLLLYSFGENLEGLVYIYWPGLVMLGIAMKEKFPSLKELSTKAMEPKLT